MPNLEKATMWLRLAVASGVVGGTSVPAKSFDIRETDSTTPRVDRGVVPTVETGGATQDVANAMNLGQPVDLSWQANVLNIPLSIDGNIGLGGVNVGPDEAPNPHLYLGLKHEKSQDVVVGNVRGQATFSVNVGTTVGVTDVPDLQIVQERVASSSISASYRVEWQPEHLRRDGLKNSVELYARGEGFNTDTPSATVGVRGVMPFGE